MLHMTVMYLANALGIRAGADRGASLVEYALLVALIATVCIGAISLLGTQVQEPYSIVHSHLSN